jgi:hypothetical protein
MLLSALLLSSLQLLCSNHPFLFFIMSSNNVGGYRLSSSATRLSQSAANKHNTKIKYRSNNNNINSSNHPVLHHELHNRDAADSLVGKDKNYDLSSVDWSLYDDCDYEPPSHLLHNSSLSSDESSSSDDDAAELAAEIEILKAERAAAKSKAVEEKNNSVNLINPVASSNILPSLGTKRKFNSGAVFLNQSNSAAAAAAANKSNYINDQIRSEFHKNFMRTMIR